MVYKAAWCYSPVELVERVRGDGNCITRLFPRRNFSLEAPTWESRLNFWNIHSRTLSHLMAVQVCTPGGCHRILNEYFRSQNHTDHPNKEYRPMKVFDTPGSGWKICNNLDILRCLTNHNFNIAWGWQQVFWSRSSLWPKQLWFRIFSDRSSDILWNEKLELCQSGQTDLSK